MFTNKITQNPTFFFIVNSEINIMGSFINVCIRECFTVKMSPAKFLNGENNSNNPNGKKNSQQGKRSCVFTKTYIFNVANFVVVYDRLD